MKPSLAAQSLAEGDKLDISVYRKDRICRKPECQKKISIYNPGPTCHTHAAWWIDKEARKMETERYDRVIQYKKIKISTGSL